MIHWGTAVDPELDPENESAKDGPRIAMNWVTGDTEFEQPALKTSFPTRLKEKVAFCAAQLIGYTVQTGILTKNDKYLYWRLFSSCKSYFNDWYYDKIANLYWLYYKKNDNVQLKKVKTNNSSSSSKIGEEDKKMIKKGDDKTTVDECKGGEILGVQFLS